MKTIYKIAAFAALAMTAAACNIDEIQPYQVENSAVVFRSKSNPFSIKGVMDPTIVLEIPVDLIGVMTEYDREINVSVLPDTSNTAVEGQDFNIIYKTLDHDTYKGVIRLEVKNLTEDVEKLCTTLQIKANQYFIDGIPAESKTYVEWSKEYVRPEEGVWRYWYTYFSRYYSKAYHELMLSICGENMEYTTNSKSYVTKNPELEYQLPTWWYAKTRLFYSEVEKHDAEHPDDPYMHSADVMKYTGYTMAISDGEVPETIPTILETLTKL